MKNFPCAKINLGLNIVSRRADGYHNLETVFFPVDLTDTLEICVNQSTAPANMCILSQDGATLDCNPEDNLVVKAYHLLASQFKLPPIEVKLCKRIPSQAGLGGGSSDAAHMIRLLNQQFSLHLSTYEMQRFAANLGADCAFFIGPVPAFATGIGEILTPIPNLNILLKGKHLVVVKPQIAVPTREAFSNITPKQPAICCRDAVKKPLTEWKDLLKNDFEDSVFPQYPELATIKERLYNLGALYAQMSGSGSSIFGIFNNLPKDIVNHFPNCFTFCTVV